MKWSDGEPADSADARFSSSSSSTPLPTTANIGLGYLDPTSRMPGSPRSSARTRPRDRVHGATIPTRLFQIYLPDPPEARLGRARLRGDRRRRHSTPPLVGSGPYTLAEWETGEFIRLVRNENYWGEQGFAGRDHPPDLRRRPTRWSRPCERASSTTPAAPAPTSSTPPGRRGVTRPSPARQRLTQLAFNTYGTGTGKTIEDGGPSTQALLDPAFRDALGYAIDKPALVDDGARRPTASSGTTNVPPVLGYVPRRARPRRGPST